MNQTFSLSRSLKTTLSCLFATLIPLRFICAEPAIVTGAGPGGGPQVTIKLFNTMQDIIGLYAYQPDFRGGVSVASCDLNGDGISDVITGAGPGGGPNVRAFDGKGFRVNNPLLLASFFAYPEVFRGGVFVACADFNSDGFGDILTGAGPGGGPVVRAIDGRVLVTTGQIQEVYPTFYAFEASFTGGVSVAAADLNRDGRPEIIVGAGPGGAPHVKIWNGADLQVIASFYAFAEGFRGGVEVAAGDISGDGEGDAIIGAGPGGGPAVAVFTLTRGIWNTFYAFDSGFRGGVHVGSFDYDRDGAAEVVIGAGATGGPAVRIMSGRNLAQELRSFYAYPEAFRGGVFVAGGNFPIPQCSDGLDNDGDGLTNQEDPGCYTDLVNGTTYDGLRNNEALATSQCQDGRDNDGDGVSDAQDPGCWIDPANPASYDRRRNNEGVATTQCQNGRDDDGDRFIDSADPGCFANPADSRTYDRTRNNEAAANPTPTPMPARTATSTPRRTPTPARVPTVKPPTPKPNRTATSVPMVPTLKPIATSTALPTSVVPTLIPTITPTPTPTRTPTVIPTQLAACVDSVSVNVVRRLDEVALQLSDMAVKAAERLLLVAQRQGGAGVAAAQRDVTRSKNKAAALLTEAQALTLGTPVISRTCPNLPPVCREISNAQTITGLKRNYLESGNLVARTLNRSGFRRGGVASTKAFNRTILEARGLVKAGYAALDRLPATAVSCG